MAVDGEEEPRAVGQHLVQIGSGGALRAEHVHPPSEATHRAGGVLLCVVGDRGQRVLAGRDLQVDTGGEERPEERMDMGLDEAGHQQTPGKVDDAGVRTRQRHGAVVVADVGDRVSGDRDRLRPGRRVGQRVDPAAVEDHIRVGVLHRSRRGALTRRRTGGQTRRGDE